jgi:serine/threonine protein kinase
MELKGRYRLERRLGHGGMASVWLGEDLVLERPVAVKVPADTFGGSREFLARFRREAKVAASLSHPNLVGVYDYSEAGERPYLVMEFVPGRNLAERIRDGADLDREALARELLSALAHIHAAGILHRDVKPQNLIVGHDGHAKLIDFGIALPAEATALTQTGLVIGTERYAAPEVLRGAPATERTDLYACGLVIAGIPGEGPPALDALLARLTSEEPGDRPVSAVQALSRLDAPARDRGQATVAFTPVFARDEAPEPPTRMRVTARPRSRLPRWVAAAAIVVAAAAVGTVLLTQGSGSDGRGGGQAIAKAGDHRDTRSTAAKAGSVGEETTAETAGPAEEPESKPAAEPTPPAAKSTPPNPKPPKPKPAPGDPVAGAALNEEGYALLQAGQAEEAVPILEAAVKSFPADSKELNYAYALFNLGQALRLSGRAHDAIPVLQKRLQIPDQTPVVERELAAAEAEAG